jgi:hypothetical protein
VSVIKPLGQPYPFDHRPAQNVRQHVDGQAVAVGHRLAANPGSPVEQNGDERLLRVVGIAQHQVHPEVGKTDVRRHHQAFAAQRVGDVIAMTVNDWLALPSFGDGFDASRCHLEVGLEVLGAHLRSFFGAPRPDRSWRTAQLRAVPG